MAFAVGALTLHPTPLYACEISADGLSLDCSGGISPPSVLEPGSPLSVDDNALASFTNIIGDITNTDGSLPALGVFVTSDIPTTSARATLSLNPDGGLKIGSSETTSFIAATSDGTSGADGFGTSGSGDRNAGAGAGGSDAPSIYFDISNFDALVLSVPSSSDLSNATIYLRTRGGAGGAGGGATSTAFGEAYGGNGGSGGDGAFQFIQLTNVTIGRKDAVLGLIAENADGGIVADSGGARGGDGGGATAIDKTAGGGSGGAGGLPGDIFLPLAGENFIAAQQVGISLSGQAGDGGNGARGRQNLAGQTSRGGQGGKGGDGSAISIFSQANTGTLNILVQDGPGILLQSLAGDGGDGGDASGGGDAVAGTGGIGGNGRNVRVTLGDYTDSVNSISTVGDGGIGIYARSHGGAGGDGGSANGFKASGGGTLGAGNGGPVSLTYLGAISTNGLDSDAIRAQSIGGFAGSGGNAKGLDAYGANLESAGAGGEVTVIYEGGLFANGAAVVGIGQIRTLGDHSDGIFAQSLGGGGGKAGSADGLSALAGSGAAGGDGGTVAVTSSGGAIITAGERSRGIFAQSTGGTGGDGGSSKALQSIGGSGAAGGRGGAVSVVSTTEIFTGGEDAIGIVAQSVGGGGGSAASTQGLDSIGGSGGSGATGGTVSVQQSADIATSGSRADGIFAQSVGGSGGHGSNTLGVGAFFSLSVSGSGGTGNHGGDVAVDADLSNISTSGDSAKGIVALSTGGGGGSAGNSISASGGPIDVAIAIGADGGSAGAGGDVAVSHDGSVGTVGDNAVGILATSIGGSGGIAGTTVSASLGLGAVGVGVGGNGSGGGDGGDVTLCRGLGEQEKNACDGDTVAGAVSTAGEAATGVYVTSVGGGGGHTATTVAASLATGADVSVGGDGGAGGTGGDINVFSSGSISTSGNAAAGLVAKSVGGSGGTAYLAGAFGGIGVGNAAVSIGGSGGAGAGSGTINVTSTDTIETQGDLSPGIVSLSQSGSGGMGGAAISATGVSTAAANLSVGGAGGSSGFAGLSIVEWKGNTLTTHGDQSAGIVSQSSGGSGGVGGFAVSGAGVGLASVGVSVGGEGGIGGFGGFADADVFGDIITYGNHSDGASALSQGGNGGRGGFTVAGNAFTQGSANVSVGGGGGSGGVGGGTYAGVQAGGSITTNGTSSHGVTSASMGGNGGKGGMALETGLNVAFSSGYPAGGAAVSIGGSGGDGGRSNEVLAQNRGTIITKDYDSNAVVASSLAGSGGMGGMSLTGSANIAASKTVNVGVSIGGGGGTGGQSGTATAENSGLIETYGDSSKGIVSQSIGGNGGLGGGSYNILANMFSGGTFDGNFEIAIGGAGGGGGIAGTAIATNTGSIVTQGTESSGLYVQSIGGNGGSGGIGGNAIFNLGKQSADADSSSSIKAAVNVAVGGTGGDSAIGGLAEANNHGGTISTSGATAYGIFAQSVGGNGGDGGSASNFSFSKNAKCQFDASSGEELCEDENNKKTKRSGSLSISIGASGGIGNHAGDVIVENIVTNGGLIQTTGENAHALVAQSIGGGGGTGGSTLSKPISYQSSGTSDGILSSAEDMGSQVAALKGLKNYTSYNLFVGGQGGAAGDGGDLSVLLNGVSRTDSMISTSGMNANGVYAQSVGGAGGSGGATSQNSKAYALRFGGSGGGGGDGGRVTVSGDTGGLITTLGYGSTGVFAQSVGAGGGSAGAHFSAADIYLLNLQIGGRDGVAGNGGVVTVNLDGDYAIFTQDLEAPGIVAQSIGGGGGYHSGGGENADGTVEVGGAQTGSVSGNGGDVRVTHRGGLYTGSPDASQTGTAASHGILAQSIGGGGGYGGSVLLSDIGRIGSGALSTSQSANGSGGGVDVDIDAQVFTFGKGSVGIFAQSVGGGGGIQGDVNNTTTDAAYVGSFGGTGVAGKVTVSQSGQLLTNGDYAHGIVAQYAGGSGTLYSTDTTVDVSINGELATGNFSSFSDDGAFGVYASSTGNGAGAVSVKVGENGSIDADTGVFVFSNGVGNTLTNHGSITGHGDQSNAVINLGSLLTIDNFGTIAGNIVGSTDGVSAPAPMALNNNVDATLEAGSSIETTTLVNDGTIQIGGVDTVAATKVTGNITQSATGKLILDIDTDSEGSDSLFVDGDAALDGTVGIRLFGTGGLVTKTSNILTVSGTLDAEQLLVDESPAARHEIREVRPGELQLTTTIDFNEDTLLGALPFSHGTIANHVDGAYVNALLPEAAAALLIGSDDVGTYTATLRSLGTEVGVASQISSLSSALGFADSLFSCVNPGSGVSYFDDGQCSYFGVSGVRFVRDETADLDGFSDTSVGLSFGRYFRTDGDDLIGGSVDYTRGRLGFESNATSTDYDRVRAGLSYKRISGNWEFAGAAFLGYGEFDISRDVATNDTALGSQSEFSYGAELRATYAMDYGDWSALPGLAIGVTGYDRSSYTETGSSDLELSVRGEKGNFVYLRPNVEFKQSRSTSGGSEFTRRMALSVTHLLGDRTVDTSAGLASASPAVDPFIWSTEMDRTSGKIELGIDVKTRSSASFSLRGFGEFSANSRELGIFAKYSIQF